MLFRDKRHEINTFLEIGIGCLEKEQMTHVRHLGYKTGNSLRAWSYYFPSAKIYALDINPEAMIQGEQRITTFTADQSNKEQLEAICREISSPLEIVIDDGSHRYEHQVASFVFLEPFLSPGAIYCIEDVHQNNSMKFGNLLGFPEELRTRLQDENQFSLTFFDRRRASPKWEDDIIVVIQKK